MTECVCFCLYLCKYQCWNTPICEMKSLFIITNRSVFMVFVHVDSHRHISSNMICFEIQQRKNHIAIPNTSFITERNTFPKKLFCGNSYRFILFVTQFDCQYQFCIFAFLNLVYIARNRFCNPFGVIID